MAYLSRGQSWEDIIRKQQEARDGKLEKQKAAATRAMQQEARDGELEKQRAAATRALQAQMRKPRQFQQAAPRIFRRKEEYVSELEVQESPPPKYQQHIPSRLPSFSSTTTKTSSSSSSLPNAESNAQIRLLKKALQEKETRIQTLESDLRVHKDARLRLQAERHDAVNAQRRAHDEELRYWKAQVANLDQLLEDSIRRQRELESELETAREGILELKRRLHEERCRYESERQARETREMRRFGNEMGRERGAGRDVGSIAKGEGKGQSKRTPSCYKWMV